MSLDCVDLSPPASATGQILQSVNPVTVVIGLLDTHAEIVAYRLQNNNEYRLLAW